MNDFEELARRLKPRLPPGEWRDLVLRAERPPGSPREHHWWAGRGAWIVLAAIWVVLGFLATAHRTTPPANGSTASRTALRPELGIPPELVAFLSPP